MELAKERYLSSMKVPSEGLRYNNEAWQRYLDADENLRKAESAARRFGSKVPIIGLGITAAGIGYDIHQGKPAGKAIISGVVGAGAAYGVGALVASAAAGAQIGMLGGPVGIVVGGVVGVGASLIASGAADYAYDQLPEGVKNGIEDGFNAVADAVGDAGKAVGDTLSAAGENTTKIWNAIF
jgi:hypothetical protein